MFFEKFQILPPNPGQIYDAGLKIETGCELGSLNHEELPEALDLSSSGLAATWPLLASDYAMPVLEFRCANFDLCFICYQPGFPEEEEGSKKFPAPRRYWTQVNRTVKKPDSLIIPSFKIPLEVKGS